MSFKMVITRFKWTLDFEKLSADCHCSEEILKSQEFAFNDTKFQLKLVPKKPYSEEEEYDEESNQSYLYMVVKDWGKHEEIKVKSRLWLECDEGRMISLQKEQERTFKKEDYHWKNVMFGQYHEEFMNTENYAEPDKVTFFCDLYHEQGELEKESNEIRQKLCFYGEKGILERCIIKAKDKQQHFSITKASLMIHSDFFEKMFMTDTKESRSNMAKLEDIDADTLQLLIAYFNSGKMSGMEKYAEELFIASDLYQIDKLQKECIEYLSSSMDKFNSFRRLKIAFTYNSKEFREHCLAYVTDPTSKGNFEDIMMTKAWKRFCVENDETSNDIIKAIRGKKEWISKNPKEE